MHSSDSWPLGPEEASSVVKPRSSNSWRSIDEASRSVNRAELPRRTWDTAAGPDRYGIGRIDAPSVAWPTARERRSCSFNAVLVATIAWSARDFSRSISFKVLETLCQAS